VFKPTVCEGTVAELAAAGTQISVRQSAAKVPAKRHEISDEALIKAIAAGDRGAMAMLYTRHRLRVWRFLMRLCRDATLAEDLLSDVFFDLWRCAAQFRGKSSVSTWLLAIARYKAFAALRHRATEPFDEDAIAAAADSSDDPEVAADKAARGAALRECLRQLSPGCRQAIDLVYYHHKSVTETARILGIPANTVKTRMFHARRKLGELLRQAGIAGI
jgi:RNA polymerase sigma-70 factor (ECF subfamily)